MLDKITPENGRRKRATLRDIAALAGVGTATVERALNNRGNVRPDTCRRILGIARDLDYFPTLPSLHQGVLRVDVLLVRPDTLFYSRLSQSFEKLAASLGKDIQIHRSFVPESDVEAFAARIQQAPYPRSALILACPSHPVILDALKRVADQDMPVIQLMSRNLASLPYVGIDNRAAGRTAALCMTRSLRQRPGSVIALCHSMAYANHRERIEGFSEYLANAPSPHPELSEVLFDRDDPEEAARLLHQAIRDRPDLVGVYTAGGDNLRIGDVLRRHAARRLCWIGHEVNPITRGCLIDGTMDFAIDQTPETQAGLALHLCLQKLGIIPSLIGFDPPKFRLVTSENLD
ncbi:LacI family transcriptional regulator [Asaia sp. W19]|uniref:LacI family DNA-binding transcriptional regulator n=1 Tax=unclassified Asaia TaxID=2685023 RepID=UPI000F8DA14A|nr:LacI family DNA-binding transcriptional regulator [Asaia sp. W19]RUT24808.1 LacI family transcriptional regulator [Asaia sp. W19]